MQSGLNPRLLAESLKALAGGMRRRSSAILEEGEGWVDNNSGGLGPPLELILTQRLMLSSGLNPASDMRVTPMASASPS